MWDLEKLSYHLALFMLESWIGFGNWKCRGYVICVTENGRYMPHVDIYLKFTMNK